MSGIEYFKVACPKCGATRGHACVVATGRRRGTPLADFHMARLSAYVKTYVVTLWHCSTHGLTTEYHERAGNGWESDITCAVSLGTGDYDGTCEEPLTGPYRATLDDGAAVALTPPSADCLPHAGRPDRKSVV